MIASLTFWRGLSRRFIGPMREQFANQLLFEYLEPVPNREKRLLIVAGQFDEDVIHPAQGATNRHFELLVSFRVLFGVLVPGVKRLGGRIGFVGELIGDLRGFVLPFGADQILNFAKLRVRKFGEQLGLVHCIGFGGKAGAQFGGVVLGEKRTAQQRRRESQARKSKPPRQRCYLFLFFNSRSRVRARAVASKYMSLVSSLFNCKNFWYAANACGT